MRFVDEQDDRRGRALHLVDQALEAVFEFALDARARLQQRQIERADVDVSQRRRDIALHDAHGEAFDDGGFADARLAGEDRVVLAAAHEDVDDLADFEIAAEDGVDFALAGVLGQVDGVLIEVGRFAGTGVRRRGASGG